MPLFFFHVRDADQRLSRDELGVSFPDLGSAYLEVLRAAKDLESEFAARGKDPKDYVIVVANASHELVFDLPFSFVIGR